MPEQPPPVDIEVVLPPRPVPAERSEPPRSDAAVEYARRLFENVMSWYRGADAKAQVILTIDGAFLAFLTGAMFTEPGELRAIVAEFSAATWLLLLLMTLALVASIFSALACLWSRIYSRNEVRNLFDRLGVDVRDAGSYAPEVMWFFQFVGRLEAEPFRARLPSVDATFEVDTLASQIRALSRNVARKHLWVNAGFLLAGCSLVLFLAAGVGYVTGL
ncbi:MAG TPA: hypothetical protein VF188_16200 [Longimicrobiales bacterium]